MAKKTSSFNKHVYSLIAVVVLLVAAGIASYGASVPSGTATHATLYVNTLFGKGVGNIDVNDTLTTNNGFLGKSTSPSMPGVLGTNTFNNGVGVTGYSLGTDGVGVIGSGTTGIQGIGASGNTGKLGTANAGVEGTVDSATGFGVYGEQAAGGYAVKGLNTDSGNYGEIGGVSTGVKGYGSSYGVQGGTGLSGLVGVDGFTSNPAGYAGRFTGGKGLYTNKIEIANSGFDESDGLGLWVIATVSANPCNVICANHGSSCYSAYYAAGTSAGCAITTGVRYCWCGRA